MRADVIEADQRKMREDLDHIKSALEVAEGNATELRKLLAVADAKPFTDRSSAPARNPNEWDKTLLWLTAHNLVGLEAVKDLAADLLARAGLKQDVAELRGPNEGKQFRLHFKDVNADTAGRRVTQVLGMLRAGGSWEKCYIDRPTGGKEQIFVGADRSEIERKKGRALTALATAIAERYPAVKPYKQRREGAITFQWQVIVS